MTGIYFSLVKLVSTAKNRCAPATIKSRSGFVRAGEREEEVGKKGGNLTSKAESYLINFFFKKKEDEEANHIHRNTVADAGNCISASPIKGVLIKAGTGRIAGTTAQRMEKSILI